MLFASKTVDKYSAYHQIVTIEIKQKLRNYLKPSDNVQNVFFTSGQSLKRMPFWIWWHLICVCSKYWGPYWDVGWPHRSTFSFSFFIRQTCIFLIFLLKNSGYIWKWFFRIIFYKHYYLKFLSHIQSNIFSTSRNNRCNFVPFLVILKKMDKKRNKKYDTQAEI